MKKILYSALICSLFSGSVLSAETYQLDPNHTTVVWHVNHFHFSTISGKWLAKGTLVLDEANPTKSQVKAMINMNDLVTGVPALDEHLRGPNFFDTQKFPTATFTSYKIDMRGKKTAKVYGNLTLHGITKTIILDVTLNQVGDNPITNKKAVGFSGKANLKRSDFDISTLTPGVSDNVALEIEAEGSLADTANANH